LENRKREVDMLDLVGKEVEVVTVEAVYSGVLIQVTEDEVLLQSESGWISVPTEKVALVREKEK
jgi:ferredoxin-fold anticodon binding domain-containing protein